MTRNAFRPVPERTDDSSAVPPFRPDPDIIGNIEGNKRIQEQDRKAAREVLRELESAH
ncbi:MAG: hypothetical protein J0I11_19660 [Actinobacteria bacterium]|jgi:hypothetical protein|nr:hypothetical protein [Actinomycetota bacterium]